MHVGYKDAVYQYLPSFNSTHTLIYFPLEKLDVIMVLLSQVLLHP